MGGVQSTQNQALGCVVIAAPHSGSGKTVLTIGLLRALAKRGVLLSPAKIGPDYIDPQFHQVAAGAPSFNIDGWAMREAALHRLCLELETPGALLLIEGVMGLFDGAVKPGVLGHGATADIVKTLKAPVVLVVDCAGMGQSVAALVKGFQTYDRDVKIAGVILNKLGSLRHVTMMKEALSALDVPVLGAVPRAEDMALASRHLGLVQAHEMEEIDARIDRIADWVASHVDLDQLLDIAAGAFVPGCQSLGAQTQGAPLAPLPGIKPLSQHVAIARDAAFAFFYPHMAAAWRGQGAALSFFSPLNDEIPDPAAGAVFLPGGYPELFAGKLAANRQFLDGLQAAAAAGKPVYGECGGYMVLGEGLIDQAGGRHKMAGLLKLETSFEQRKLHLGYRYVRDALGQAFRGHEFHYSTVLKEEGTPLFHDAEGEGHYGLTSGPVAGSFVHLIDEVNVINGTAKGAGSD